ncbi:LuxR family transcriptional regulator [Mesorhizobium sp. CO1-1-11]|uniref:LuxR family transcriptional regulator n=1 Tax=Mesorhizobium sp. CO1-1-11 TaxID=2876636 RepID=UPI001CCEBAD9|nr:LuxR family transcriptional regulator [Mesorhizobium sp. CO1-1-11]MBZ9726323.1 LuxR family transcriptional regulator [Mesorhizobium sp. CO1-1-11]
MALHDFVFRDFVDALETAHDDVGFRGAADRFAKRLGYRWFAYLGFSEPALKVLSSYPTSWAQQYMEQRYEDIDPVIGLARSSRRLFQWSRRTLRLPSASQQRFFAEAAKFGIQSGATVPIPGGFGRFAAFTVAGNGEESLEDHPAEVMDTLQLAGLYYHAHVYAKLQLGLARVADAPLTQRERQCLSWAASGKKMPETAKVLGITTRTVVFHLENARSKLGASTVAQAVVEAAQRGLI